MPFTLFALVYAAAAGPTEEEYVLLSDYVTDIEGELSVSAGDVVQLINREATGNTIVKFMVTLLC